MKYLYKCKFYRIARIFKGRKFNSHLITENPTDVPYIDAITKKMNTVLTIYDMHQFITKISNAERELSCAVCGDSLITTKGHVKKHVKFLQTKGFEVCFSKEVTALHPINNTDPRFLFMYVSEMFKDEEICKRIMHRHPLFVSWKSLNNLEVNFVVPLEQKFILNNYDLLERKIARANVMCHDIMADMMYIYHAFFDDDRSERVTIGSSIQRCISFSNSVSTDDGGVELKTGWVDMKNFDDTPLAVYDVMKYPDEHSKYPDCSVPDDSICVAVKGFKAGKYFRNTPTYYYPNTFYALVPNDNYPSLYIYFEIMFNDGLLESKIDKDNKELDPFIIDALTLSSDIDRVRNFVDEVEAPFNDMLKLETDIFNMEKLRDNVFSQIVKNEYDHDEFKNAVESFDIYN